ncbi:50S ribosomal protein L7/L12 [bacterium]|nr:50S ribosomal protein L7/L12 [bacterium]
MCPEENAPEIQLSDNAQAILDGIEKLTVMELADLVKALEEKFGVSAAAPMAMAAIPVGAAAAEVAEEKTQFTPMLTSIGDQKIKVIKEVRGVTDLGLKEAKDFVESTLPAAIKEDIPEDEAKKIKEAVEAVGATVEIK